MTGNDLIDKFLDKNITPFLSDESERKSWIVIYVSCVGIGLLVAMILITYNAIQAIAN